MLNNLQRFQEKYQPEPNSGCWLWLGVLNKFGHAWFWANGKTLRAHRFSYEQKFGPIQKESELIHKCKTKCCVNPDHLLAIKTNTHRLCKACGEWKEYKDWVKSKSHGTGYGSYCKVCVCERVKKYSVSHKKEISERGKIWRLNNQAKLKVSKKKYQERIKIRERTEPLFKLKKNLRNRFGMAVKKNFKGGSAVRDLGCSIEYLKQYLEAKFQPGMSWENHSHKGWHIDHIRPLDSFDLSDREQFLQACHYTNLQPLWAKDNIVKGAKISEEDFHNV